MSGAVVAADREWDAAPCGLLVLAQDGTVRAVNRSVLGWLDCEASDVVGRRLPDLFSVGGRIYWETHLAPLLRVESRLTEVAVDLKAPGGNLPVLLTAVADSPAGPVRVALSTAAGRAHYERELRAAHAAAELVARRLRALQRTTEGLSSAVGVDAVATGLLAAAVGPLGAAGASLWLLDSAGELSPHGAAREELDPAGLPPALALSTPEAARRGSRVVVPLHGPGGLRGVLSLSDCDDPGADPLDLEVLTAVGQQAGLALDRAALYEHNADVARTLQHSLLAGSPPTDPRYAMATAYRPGVASLEVGGDWHDAFLADDDVLAVVVGDVVGRGLHAASAMGQLRSAVRAVAGPGVGPAPARLPAGPVRRAGPGRRDGHRRVRRARPGRRAALLHLRRPPAAAAAAHRRADAPAVGRAGRTPLGAFLQPQPRTEADVRLSTGDRLCCTPMVSSNAATAAWTRGWTCWRRPPLRRRCRPCRTASTCWSAACCGTSRPATTSAS